MIGTHYGWNPGPPSLRDRTKDHQSRAHHCTIDAKLASTMVRIEDEIHLRSGYVSDVGNQVLQKDEKAGVYSEVAERMSISKILAASSTTQRVLLMALLIASSALALSALVSAMQGFDTLFFS